MTTTIKDAADDASFITALMALQGFNDKVYIKAAPADEVYTKTASDTAFVKATELKTKAAAKDVVDAITASSDFTNKVYIKAAPADEVYTKTAADTAFVKTTDLATKVAEQAVVDILVPALATVGTDDTKKVYTKGTVDTSFAKIDASNFTEAILSAKDGQKSILINKLGEALDRVADDKATDKVYGAKGSEKIAKDFLADKGLKPMPKDVATELAKNAVFQANNKIQVSSQDPEFQAAVKTVMSQPSFEIPIDPSAPLSWDW
ncbi:hypothetical protein JSQ73_005405 [Wolbachia endosymbiont of Anopheles demeilloni]|uniref:hypothetical protein n=1 Tax=Wolbachia endosymbiont of Anopheles demeilloni TaxID=2748871 RepID=UPI001BD9F40B|nr:hypothetical protein [Wolbachia endosymbiont of Anopheles demeilloni]UIP92589.1 hypothetical protein JSQ73_005405 [Wolbachia endosymbiont of Anopheles demeilloni]